MIINTRLLMSLSAMSLMALGVVLNFLPGESYQAISNTTTEPASALAIQLLGGALFGFGMINWTARGNLIGGIYNRPVAIGNFAHFLIGSLA